MTTEWGPLRSLKLNFWPSTWMCSQRSMADAGVATRASADDIVGHFILTTVATRRGKQVRAVSWVLRSRTLYGINKVQCLLLTMYRRDLASTWCYISIMSSPRHAYVIQIQMVIVCLRPGHAHNKEEGTGKEKYTLAYAKKTVKNI